MPDKLHMYIESGVPYYTLNYAGFSCSSFDKAVDMESGLAQEVSPASINDYQPNPPLNAVEFPSSPGPIRVIEPVEEEHTFKLNEEFLQRVLLDPRVADKKVTYRFVGAQLILPI